VYLALGTAYSRAGRKADAFRARSTFQRLTEEAKKSAGEPGPSQLDENPIRADAPH
jgi:hypothetical protein